MDYMEQEPYLIGHWMDQAGRVDENGKYSPSNSPEPENWMHVDLAGHDVKLCPLRITQYGHTTNQTHAIWEEGPYRFILTRPGNTALSLQVFDQRTIDEGITSYPGIKREERDDPAGQKVGRCTFWADNDGKLKLVMPEGLMENKEFCSAMVTPVMQEAQKVADQWHLDQKLHRIASNDQVNARMAEIKHARGEVSEKEIDTAIGLAGIDLENEADKPELGGFDL